MCEENHDKEMAMELIAEMTVIELGKKYGINTNEAIAMFMDSETADQLFDSETGDYLSGPVYVLNEFIAERENRH